MVKATTNIKTLPAKAINIESLLDIILQILNVISAFTSLFGIDLSFGGNK